MARQVLCPCGTSEWQEETRFCEDLSDSYLQETDFETESNIFHIDLGECDSERSEQIVQNFIETL